MEQWTFSSESYLGKGTAFWRAAVRAPNIGRLNVIRSIREKDKEIGESVLWMERFSMHKKHAKGAINAWGHLIKYQDILQARTELLYLSKHKWKILDTRGISKTGKVLSERLTNRLADAYLSIRSVGSSAMLCRQSMNPGVHLHLYFTYLLGQYCSQWAIRNIFDHQKNIWLTSSYRFLIRLSFKSTGLDRVMQEISISFVISNDTWLI